jgi:hypothetical protein
MELNGTKVDNRSLRVRTKLLEIFEDFISRCLD